MKSLSVTLKYRLVQRCGSGTHSPPKMRPTLLWCLKQKRPSGGTQLAFIHAVGRTSLTCTSQAVFLRDCTLPLKARRFAFEKSHYRHLASKSISGLSVSGNPDHLGLEYEAQLGGENGMFQDVCTIQLSNIHTVMILKESTQCREIGNKIKAPGYIERRRPKDSSLIYLIPGTGN